MSTFQLQKLYKFPCKCGSQDKSAQQGRLLLLTALLLKSENVSLCRRENHTQKKTEN